MGIILTKELILVDKAACQRVGELKMRSAPQLNSETRLYDMLRLFETGRCHMAVLAHNPGTPLPHGARAPAPTGHTVSKRVLRPCVHAAYTCAEAFAFSESPL